LSHDDCLTAFPALCAELNAYNPSLLVKKRLIVGTKLDMDGAPERLAALCARCENERVFGISVFSRAGLKELAAALKDILKT
ncbi:MAG: GTPase ObgE, partial [Spirochaetaceae bacterium]|jgi:GTP-binding protein|nr:GTPase ObgE [Spirochaetaceae bacterium]